MRNEKRCPWCGRYTACEPSNIIKNSETNRKVFRCNSCCKPVICTYGYPRLYFIIIFLGFYLIKYPALLTVWLITIFGIYLLFIRKRFIHIEYERGDEKGNWVINDSEEYRMQYDSKVRIRKGDILLTDRNFDEKSLIIPVSPILITQCNHRTQTLEYVFLYDHPNNSKLFSDVPGAFVVYKNNIPIRLWSNTCQQTRE